MNTTDGLVYPNNGSMGGFAYGIGVAVGVLFLITTITVASYFCARAHTSVPQHQQQRPVDSNVTTIVVVGGGRGAGGGGGLDEAALLSCPKLTYAQARSQRPESIILSSSTCCSICLTDYKDSDLLRQLPDCGHLFHVKCVDPWLKLHSTCPMCRTSPLPSPLPTPLAEVVPLSRHLIN